MKEDQVVIQYVTTADSVRLVEAFYESDNTEELRSKLQQQGFQVEKLEASVRLNFDDRR